MSCGGAAVRAIAAVLLAVLLVGAAEGKLISEVCQDHCSGTYPEHTYPNPENPRACRHGCRYAQLDALISWPMEANVGSCHQSCREGYVRQQDQQFACFVGCRVRTISSLSHHRTTFMEMDSFSSLNEHALQLDNWAGTYRYIEVDLVVVHAATDNNSSLQTMEVIVHRTVAGGTFHGGAGGKTNDEDRQYGFVWINMNVLCIALIAVSIMFCFCAACHNVAEHRRPTIKHQVCKEKGIHYNMLQPQTKQSFNNYTNTVPVMANNQCLLPVQVQVGQKQPQVVEGVLTIVS